MSGQQIVSISVKSSSVKVFENGKRRAKLKGLSFSEYVIKLIAEDLKRNPSGIEPEPEVSSTAEDFNKDYRENYSPKAEENIYKELSRKISKRKPRPFDEFIDGIKPKDE